jgi:hypothetical protein
MRAPVRFIAWTALILACLVAAESAAVAGGVSERSPHDDAGAPAGLTVERLERLPALPGGLAPLPARGSGSDCSSRRSSRVTSP